jgi:hypothetical protein
MNPTSLRCVRSILVVAAALTLLRCGSSPNAPSGAGAKLQGVVLQNATAHAQSLAQSAQAGKITVTVQEDPSLTVTVSGNGTFEIQGVPAGGFTLVFSLNGTTIGQIRITAVAEGTTIKIVVKVADQEVELVEIETEDADETQTGGTGGTGGSGGSGGTGDGGSKTCMIEGGKVGAHVELEGNVESGGSSQFRLRVNGNRSSGLVDVSASGASYKCNGNKGNTDCKANLRSGAKVHVRGALTSCSTSAASVTATEVMIQKD